MFHSSFKSKLHYLWENKCIAVKGSEKKLEDGLGCLWAEEHFQFKM